MQRLILSSIANQISKKNFIKTIKQGILFKDLPSEGKDELSRIGNLLPNSKVYFWGCKNSKYYQGRLKKISIGDTIVFALNKNFEVKGKISSIFNNTQLSYYLWQDSSFSNIIVIENLKDISIPYNEVFPILGYKPNAKLNGLVLVNKNRVMSNKDSHHKNPFEML